MGKVNFCSVLVVCVHCPVSMHPPSPPPPKKEQYHNHKKNILASEHYPKDSVKAWETGPKLGQIFHCRKIKSARSIVNFLQLLQSALDIKFTA